MTSISLAMLARRAADLGNPLPCSDGTQLWFSEHPADLDLAKGAFPLAEKLADSVLSLPMGPHVTPGQVDEVAAAIRQALS